MVSSVKKLNFGRGLQHLRQTWIEVGQTARSRITGTVRPGLPIDDHHLICRQIDSCLSALGGAVSARSRAASLGRVYLDLDLQGRRNFLRLLAIDYAVRQDDLRLVIHSWLDVSRDSSMSQGRLACEDVLRNTLVSPRIRLLTQFNDLPEGVKFLVSMRAELLAMKGSDPDLNAFDREFKALLASWFDVGFLELRRITWDAPAALLETLANHEAVHPIRSWRDIKHRLAAVDRRCYAFIHPQMPNDPLIFVWVALTSGIPDKIETLLSIQAPEVGPDDADTAVFYSISATQSGLDGVGFGSFLIKRVVERLSCDHKQLRVFSTLSPIPGFASWLKRAGSDTAQRAQYNTAVQAALEVLDESGALARIFSNRSWVRDLGAMESLRKPLSGLCAHYLVNEKRGDVALDPVANFHLSNGAGVERLNWLGDTSKKGQSQAACLMVNYRYQQKDIESNHEAYHTDGQIARSKSVAGLLKD